MTLAAPAAPRYRGAAQIHAYTSIRRAPSLRMTTARQTTGSPRRAKRSTGRRLDSDAGALARYRQRGSECAFANVRMLGRIVGAFYDDALAPTDLRASQLALLWAILACEPVERRTLERITRTDQTTLSRTVEHLRAAGLVMTEAGTDRRTRMIRLTPRVQRAFLRAMPYWEQAQRDLDAWLPIPQLEKLAKSARALARSQESD